VRSSALVGMQPQLRQMPPRCSRSTTAVFIPSCAARIAATYPPGPPPSTIRSNSWSGIRDFPQSLGGGLDGLTDSRPPAHADDLDADRIARGIEFDEHAGCDLLRAVVFRLIRPEPNVQHVSLGVIVRPDQRLAPRSQCAVTTKIS